MREDVSLFEGPLITYDLISIRMKSNYDSLVNLLLSFRGNKRKEDDRVDRDELKRPRVGIPSVEIGVEIETCIDSVSWLKYRTEGSTDRVGMFVPEHDGSIVCKDEDTQIPLEFVSRERVTFDVGLQDSQQTPSYKEMVTDLNKLFSMSNPCKRGKCGMHVHMSLPNVHVNDHPFLFVVFQN